MFQNIIYIFEIAYKLVKQNSWTMSKKDNKEQEILLAAEKMFAEKGFKGATTTLIAAEAGVT